MTRAKVLSPLLLAFLCLLPYAGALRHPYLWDDVEQLAGNHALRDARSLPRLLTRGYYGVAREESYRPVKAFSLFLSLNAFGSSPAAQRLVNAGLRSAGAGLLHAFASTCLPPGPALAAAILFAAHPVHSETVLCVSYRDELLALLFSLAALLLARRRREGAALVMYALALLSKESAILLPLVVFLRERWARAPEEQTRPPRAFYAGSALLAAGFLAARFLLLKNPEQTASYLGGSFGSNLLTMTGVLPEYLKLLAWPASLSLSYDLPVLRAPDARFWSAALLVGALAAAVAAARDRRYAFFAAWSLLSLLPVLNLVPFLQYSLLYERYLYSPSAGFCLLVALAFSMLRRPALPS